MKPARGQSPEDLLCGAPGTVPSAFRDWLVPASRLEDTEAHGRQRPAPGHMAKRVRQVSLNTDIGSTVTDEKDCVQMTPVVPLFQECLKPALTLDFSFCATERCSTDLEQSPRDVKGRLGTPGALRPVTPLQDRPR